MSDLTRREMLRVAAVGMCAACLGGESFAADEPAAKTVVIGKLADFPKPGVYDTFLRKNRILVSRLDDRLIAMTAVCTHKNKLVQLSSPAVIKCPAHGSAFTEQGTVDKGPAKMALVRYGITQAADGKITVDMSKTFEERKWDDDAAQVKIVEKK